MSGKIFRVLIAIALVPFVAGFGLCGIMGTVFGVGSMQENFGSGLGIFALGCIGIAIAFGLIKVMLMILGPTRKD